MENIFENAKFGDNFRTRDGKIAIYHYYDIANDRHVLIHEGLLYEIKHRPDGVCSLDYKSQIFGGNLFFNRDIISKF